MMEWIKMRWQNIKTIFSTLFYSLHYSIKKTRKATFQDAVNLSDHSPLNLSEAADILDMVKLRKRRLFIITNDEVSFEPKNTFFERAKQAILDGKVEV